eukprot:2302940-Pleurochrysis_carterae.AAC.1
MPTSARANCSNAIPSGELAALGGLVGCVVLAVLLFVLVRLVAWRLLTTNGAFPTELSQRRVARRGFGLGGGTEELSSTWRSEVSSMQPISLGRADALTSQPLKPTSSTLAPKLAQPAPVRVTGG